MKKILPKNLVTILDDILNNGGKPIIVGGSVRDYLLDNEVTDFDIEVYGINSFEKLESLLAKWGKLNFVGKSFGILKLKIEDDVYDFSFPRVENKNGIGHKAFDIQINSDLSFDKASRRRDFTINAIGYDYSQNEFLDPFSGLRDIKQKILKHIDRDTFIEDPLRVYRAVQFCARFELDLDIDTKDLCKEIVNTEEFRMLSKERIFQEYNKLLLKSNKPSLGLQLLNELNIEYFSETTMKNIDDMVAYKRNDFKKDIVLMYYYLFDILEKISNDKKLYKNIKELRKFKIPKIYQDKVTEIKTNAQLISIKCNILQNMPEAFILGKDLIKLGYKPSEKFGKILDKLYQLQLEGKVKNKKEAEKLISTLF